MYSPILDQNFFTEKQAFSSDLGNHMSSSSLKAFKTSFTSTVSSWNCPRLTFENTILNKILLENRPKSTANCSKKT